MALASVEISARTSFGLIKFNSNLNPKEIVHLKIKNGTM